jgi:phosphinothricin acetyltransferase
MSLTLRLARAADAAGVLAIYAPVVERTAISFELEPPSLDEMERRIARGAAWPFLVCDAGGGDVVGYAYAVPFRDRAAYRFTAESTVYVAERAHRRGIGRALYRSLLACLALQELARVIAGITLPNAASVALHEQAGFRKCAHLEGVGWKLGAWHDVGYWELALRSDRGHLPPAAEPRRIDELASTPALQAALRSGQAFLAP